MGWRCRSEYASDWHTLPYTVHEQEHHALADDEHDEFTPPVLQPDELIELAGRGWGE